MSKLLDFANRSGMPIEEFNEEIARNYACMIDLKLTDNSCRCATHKVKFPDHILVIESKRELLDE